MAKYFTLEEATALLPEIAPLLEQVAALRDRLKDAEQGLVSLHWKARANGHVTPTGSFTEGQEARAELLAQINTRIAHLHQLGIEVKDPGIGLIDFPSLREGRVVFLCWKLGEAAIEYWHDVDTGFAGRQPL